MSLEERINADSEPWRPADYPEHPNPLIMKVVDTEVGDGDYGPYPIITGLGSDGKYWRVFGFGTVLAGRIAKLKPKIGDEMAFRYLGEEPAKNFKGKTYKNFRVEKESPDGSNSSIDWDAMAKVADAAADAEEEPF